jgi:hypothetical protein
MKYFYLFSIVIMAFTNVSCDFLIDKSEKPEPVYEVTEDDVEAFTDVMSEMRDEIREERKLDSNYVMLCRYCVARVNDEVSICDSCGLAPTSTGALMYTNQQVNALEMDYCVSCANLIPEQATICKYCMAVQPEEE